jgi:hypothetical protein
VGFDISCGVRLLRVPFDRTGLEPRRAALMDELERLVPKGMGRGEVWEVGSERELTWAPVRVAPSCGGAAASMRRWQRHSLGGPETTRFTRLST